MLTRCTGEYETVKTVHDAKVLAGLDGRHSLPDYSHSPNSKYIKENADGSFRGIRIMINGNLDQFLDTGWYSEAELFYNGYLYWCEACYDSTKLQHRFIVDKWRAKTEDNKSYHSILNKDGELDYVRVYEETSENIELIKKHFLEANIFDGKSFWQIESEIAWLDESEPIKE